MSLSITPAESSLLLVQLGIAAVRTILLAACAGVLLTIFGVKATSARLATWTAVLYVGLCMPVLGWLLPSIRITVPFLPTHAPAKLVSENENKFVRVSSPLSHQFTDSKAAARNAPMARNAETSVSPRPKTHGARPSFWASLMASIRWTTVAGVIYLVVALFLLLRLLVGLAITRRLVRSSNRIHDSGLSLRLLSVVQPCGQRHLAHVHESGLVSVPVTIGVLAPTILLPISWTEWEHDKLDAVIAHEISHVIRRDTLSQCVSLLHRAIFWFSPLAWWLNRHITELAEEASDEAALSAGAERRGYARALLGFFEALEAAHSRIHWQGVSIADAGQAERRLKKVLEWSGGKTMHLTRSVTAMFVAFAVPVIYVAAAARPIPPGQSSQDSTSAQEQVSPPPTGNPSSPQPPASVPSEPSSPPPPADGGVSHSGPSPAQPISPVAPPMPAVPTPPFPPGIYQTRGPENGYRHDFSYAYGFDDEQRFVIVSGKTDAFTMSGSSEDVRHVEKLRKQIPGDFIWFERDEKSYIIRDQATIDRARQLWAPQEELGRKQEELGKHQEALGKQQEELGARMGRVHVKVPDMSAEIDKLKAELQQLGPDATVEQIGRIQAQIGELQAEIGQLQAHAGDEQGKLGAEMGALGEQQGKLGEQQGELGREQAELAQKATRAMKELLDDAIKKGIAQPETEEAGGASL